MLPYSASSGCYWGKCSFCPETAEGTPYTNIPVATVLHELEGLVGRTRPSLIHFLDNALSPALLEALSTRPIGIPWYGFARIDTRLADPEFCMALKRSGCVMLKLGLESGDQGVLDRTFKNIDLGMASLVLANLHAAGIAAYVYLLFGTPQETIDEARKTLEFTARHREAISFLNLALFNMPVNADDAAEYEPDRSPKATFPCIPGSGIPEDGAAGRSGNFWTGSSSGIRRSHRSCGTTPPSSHRTMPHSLRKRS